MSIIHSYIYLLIKLLLVDTGVPYCIRSRCDFTLCDVCVFVSVRCKPGSFNLQADNPHGCQMCFCFGHSLACSSSHQHVAFNITSSFLEGNPSGNIGFDRLGYNIVKRYTCIMIESSQNLIIVRSMET